MLRTYPAKSFIFFMFISAFLASCSTKPTQISTASEKEFRYTPKSNETQYDARIIAFEKVKGEIFLEIANMLVNDGHYTNLDMEKLIVLLPGAALPEIVHENWQNGTYSIKTVIRLDEQRTLNLLNHIEGSKYRIRYLEALSERGKDALEETENFVDKEEYEQAIKQLDRKNLLERATYFRYTSDFDSALKDLDEAIRLDPSDPIAYSIRGLVNYDRRSERAIDDFSEALARDPSRAEDYTSRGLAFEKLLDDRDKALADYNKAIELDNEFDFSFVNRGGLLIKMGDLENALKDLDAAIELSPGLSTAYYNRGIAHHDLGNYREAIRDYEKAVELDPWDYMAYNNLGWLYYGLEKYNEAIIYFTEALSIRPKFRTGYINRCRAYIASGRYSEGLEDCDRAIELKPDSAYAYFLRGWAYKNMGEENKAIKEFKIAAANGSKQAKEELSKLLNSK